MALKDCIRKAGKAIDRDDGDAILALVDEGVNEQDAIAQYIATVEAEVLAIRQRALEAGAKEVPNAAQYRPSAGRPDQGPVDPGHPGPSWLAKPAVPAGTPSFSGKPRQPDAVSAVAVHYSPVGDLTELDPAEAGTAYAGGERRRFGMGQFGKRGGIAARLNFYVQSTDQLPQREAVIAQVQGSYRVVLDNLYDLTTDPRGFYDQIETVDELEEMIAEAGFDGFIREAPDGIPEPVAVIFDLGGKTVPVANALEQDNARAAPAGSKGLPQRPGVRGGGRVLAQSNRQVLNDARREADGSLVGLPRRVGEFQASVYPAAVTVAERYMAARGLPYAPPNRYVKVNPERAKRIADAYEAMPHDPQDPEVVAAYRAMIDETVAQYQAVLDAGLTVEFIPPGAPDPYAGNPRAMTEDVRNNNHMWVFGTRDGFGSNAEFDPVDNPLLAETEFQISGQTALANDIFRVVHDYFGHVKEGVGFRADGEENAWRAHAAMYSPLARRALTTETRGQNSWVNYGPYGEQNRTASAADTHYADQKIGLLPEWVSEEGRTLEQPAYHGTPHTIGPEGFSLSKIGTGEGAQAYGWGLYFADDPSVAGSYFRALSDNPEIIKIQLGSLSFGSYNGFDYSRRASENSVENVRASLAEDLLIDETAIHGAGPGGFADLVLKVLDEKIAGYESDGEDALATAGKSLRKMLERPGAISIKLGKRTGGVYQVDIPDEAIARMLDWDKPLSQQPQNVRDALAQIDANSYAPNGSDYDANETGAIIYQRLTQKLAKPPSAPSWTSMSTDTEDRAWSAQRAASEVLFAAGIPGIRYYDQGSRGTVGGEILWVREDKDGWKAKIKVSNRGGVGFISPTDIITTSPPFKTESEAKAWADSKTATGTRNTVVFDDKIIKITHKDGSPVTAAERAAVLEQAGPAQEPVRGRIRLLPDNQRVIELTAASDRSTFLHESAHLFLELEGQLAERFGVSDQQQRILNWLGVESFADIQTEHHEKWAEAFEAYLMTGKAPSVGLRRAFADFARWLSQVYRSIREQMLGKLDAEIVDIFDRLLATQEEIDRAAGNPIYDQFFRSREQSGMTDTEWERYKEQRAKVRSSATATLQEKALKQYRRMREQEWNAERAPLVQEEMERLGALPVYEIIRDISSGYPFDWDTTLEVLGIEKPTGRLIGKLKKGGIDPADYAEQYGFGSTRQMLDAVLAAPAIKEAATAAAQARMVEKYGDVLNDGTIEQEAQQALHNDEQAELLVMEINALSRVGGPRTPPIDREYLKSEAARLMGTMTYREISPSRYYQAELRAARKAAKATNPEESRVAKIQQLANHYLYKEAVDAREKMERYRRHIRKAQDRKYDTKLVEPGYAQMIRVLARMYEMRQGDPARPVALDEYLNWHESQLKDPNQFVAEQLTMFDPALIQALEDKRAGRPVTFDVPAFEDLSYDALRGVYDQLRHLRYVGGSVSEMGRDEFNQRVREATDSILTNGGKSVPDPEAVTSAHRKLLAANDALAAFGLPLLSLDSMLATLDGGTKGIMHREVMLPLEKARQQKLQLNIDAVERYKEAFDAISRAGIRRTERTITRENGTPWTLTTSQQVMLGLYWGTASSREALLADNRGLTENDVLRMLQTMTPDQLKLVNAIWEINESFWPQLSEVATRMLGAAPLKLDPTPFEINGVRMTGGHMRLYYDDVGTEIQELQQGGSEVMSMMPSQLGSTIARVGSGGKRVLLDIGSVSRAYDDMFHWIAYAEAARQVAGVMNRRDVKDAITLKHGKQFTQEIIRNITSLVSNRSEVDTVKGMARVMRYFRKVATFRALAYSFRNAIQGLASFKFAIDKVGYIGFAKGMAAFLASPLDTIRMVNRASVVMKSRGRIMDRDARDFTKLLELGGPVSKAVDVATSNIWVLNTVVDSFLAYPTWVAKYQQELERNPDDKAEAVRRADEAVETSIGTGDDLRQGRLFHMSQSEAMKLASLFGSWFNMILNNIYRAKGTNGVRGLFTPEFVTAAVVSPLIVAVVSSLLVGEKPAEDEDWLLWALKKYGLFLAGTLPFVREFASAADTGMVRASPTGQAAGDLFRLAGKQEDLTTSDALKIAGTLVPFPGLGSVTRALDYAESYEQGREGSTFNPYQALTEGPERNR